MRERPIGDLVRALRDVGASIDFEVQTAIVLRSSCDPINHESAEGELSSTAVFPVSFSAVC